MMELNISVDSHFEPCHYYLSKAYISTNNHVWCIFSIILGMGGLIMTALGGICGGPIISRFKLQLRGLSVTLACVTALATLCTACNWLIYCPPLNFSQMPGYVVNDFLKVTCFTTTLIKKMSYIYSPSHGNMKAMRTILTTLAYLILHYYDRTHTKA